jgi:hypothetical protein
MTTRFSPTTPDESDRESWEHSRTGFSGHGRGTPSINSGTTGRGRAPTARVARP